MFLRGNFCYWVGERIYGDEPVLRIDKLSEDRIVVAKTAPTNIIATDL